MQQESCQLYQMKAIAETADHIFRSYASLAAMGYFPREKDYDMVYACPLHPSEDIRSVRDRLAAIGRSAGRFREISTGDVIVLRRAVGTACYFVDESGYCNLPQFLEASQNTGNLLTPCAEHFSVPGKNGLWKVIDHVSYGGETFFLLEHEEFGSAVPSLILDSLGRLVGEGSIRLFDSSAMEHIQRYLHPERPDKPPANQGYVVRRDDHQDDASSGREERVSVRERLKGKLNQLHST